MLFLMSVLAAHINCNATLDMLMRKVYAFFLSTPLSSYCSRKLNFLNKALKYSFNLSAEHFSSNYVLTAESAENESFWCTIYTLLVVRLISQ